MKLCVLKDHLKMWSLFVIRAIIVENNFKIDGGDDYDNYLYLSPNGELSFKEIIEFSSLEEFENASDALRSHGPKKDGWPQFKILKIIDPIKPDMKKILEESIEKYENAKKKAELNKKKAEQARKKIQEERKKKEALKEAMKKLSSEELRKLLENYSD